MMRSRFPKRLGRDTVELTSEFFEEDEPVGRVRGAFESGEKRVTGERVEVPPIQGFDEPAYFCEPEPTEVEVEGMLAEGQPVEVMGPPADTIRRDRVRRWLIFWSGTR